MVNKLTNTFLKLGVDDTKLILQCVDNKSVNDAIITYNKLSPDGKYLFKNAANHALMIAEPLIYGEHGTLKFFNARQSGQVKP